MKLARWVFTVLSVTAAFAQNRSANAIDDTRTIRLPGDRHPLARPEFDRGAIPDDKLLERMILVLTPSAAQQSELDALIEAQHDPSSPLYYQWLTPEQFGKRFGVSDSAISRLTDWLAANGLRVDEVAPGRREIIFSGTTGEVGAAFKTGIHRYAIGAEMHVANTDDPEIPEALAEVVSGIASLHDFHSTPTMTSITPAAAPDFTNANGHYLAPADFATIYDAAPLYSSGIDGSGTSIAVVGRSNFRLTDAQSFHSFMGLTANSPTVILTGPNPGIVSSGEQAEATLDVEWASAIARRAAVKFVLSASTQTTDGVLLSAQYIVNHNVAPVITTSFSACEAAAGASYARFWNNLWQQAAAEGITALVASGDSGAAGCDSPSAATASGGPSVNVICSTPYSVCVGGNQFNDTATPSPYWSAANGANLSSALSYIPEVV